MADTKISAMTAATSVADADLVPIVQGGVNKKAAANLVARQAFPAGTKMLFVQTSAPTGWTKDTDQNDKALRIVSGTPGTGGSSPFSTVFGKTATDAHTLTTSQMPSHTHDVPVDVGSGGVPAFANSTSSDPAGTTATSSAGAGGSHTHGMDIRVQYVDVIKATKD